MKMFSIVVGFLSVTKLLEKTLHQTTQHDQNMDDQEDTIDQPVALDLGSKKRRKRIIFVKTTRTPSRSGTNPALEKTNVRDARIEETTVPKAPYAGTPQPKQGGSSRLSPPRNSPTRPYLVAKTMPKYTAEKKFQGAGALSPLKSPTKQCVDEESGRVLERRILGTADDYVEMFQEENPGVPLGFDTSKVSMMSSLGSTGAASVPPPSDETGGGGGGGGGAMMLDSDEAAARRADSAAKAALAASGDAKQMKEMIASEMVAANRSDDPYRYRLNSAILRAARRARIAEARSRELAEEEEDEVDMLVCDRVVEQREAHALKNWMKMQVTWSKAKKVLAKKLKKHPDDLVLSRAEEFREKREEYDLIDNATPLHMKHGSEYWMMSLRGVGTRYVPVGNIFSGLFCPVHEDKVTDPLVIRAPGVRVPLSDRNDHPKNWRDSKTLVEKQRGLRRRIDELRPHIVDTAETNYLMVQGVDLFDWAERSSTEYYQRMDNSTRERNEAERESLVSAAAQEEKQQEEEGKAAAEGEQQQQGPRVDVTIEGQPKSVPMRLLLETDVGVEVLRNVNVQNVGTTALYVKLQKKSGSGEGNLGEGNKKERSARVHCHRQTLVVLPGHHVQIPFTFRSSIPGVFSEIWKLSTTPKTNDDAPEVLIAVRAVSIEVDTGSTRRAELEERIATKVEERRLVLAREEEARMNIPKEEIPIEVMEEKRFQKNAGRYGSLPIHYSTTMYGQLASLAQRSAAPGAAASAEFSCSLDKLEASVLATDDVSLVDEMREMETCMMLKLPSEKSSSWSAARSMLMEVALSIPELSDALREENGLEVPEIWKRPRNLVGGKREEVPEMRRAEQMCKAWEGRRVRGVEGAGEGEGEGAGAGAGEEVPTTAEGKYLQSMWSSVSSKLSSSMDGFVDAALSSSVVKRNESRKKRGMLLNDKVLSVWSKLPDDDEVMEEEEEVVKETDPATTNAEDEGEAVDSSLSVVAPEVLAASEFLSGVVDARVMVRLDTSGLVFDSDNGNHVLSDESVATELAVQRATECVLQLLAAKAGCITLVGRCDKEESLQPLASALMESLDRPVRFVETDQEAIGICVEFEEKRRVKEEARVAREAKQEEKRRVAEVKRQARVEAGKEEDDEEEEEDDDEDDEDDEDEDDEEGTCPVIVLENRSWFPCEKLSYREELDEFAEEEDIDERNSEMETYASTLSKLCDVLVNDDVVGSSTDDVTVCSLKIGKSIVGAGPRLQHELTVLRQLFQDTPRPAFCVVGGNNVKDKLNVLSLLIEMMDEIMLGVHLSPMFERVRRERWYAVNPKEEVVVVEAAGEVEAASEDNSEDNAAAGADDAAAAADDAAAGDAAVEGKVAPKPVVLTPEEDSLLPAVRYLFRKAEGRGVVLHTCVDYVLGDVAPTSAAAGNYEVEYSGEVTEYAVTPLVAPVEEVGEGEGEESAPVVEEEEDDEDEEDEDEDEEESEKLAPDDPRVIRGEYGMPPSLLHTLDIGPLTQETWAKELQRATSVLWLDPVGCVAHGDFAAGSQALLDALAPEESGEVEEEAANAVSTAKLVALFGEELIGSMRAGGMADEDMTLVSAGGVRTVEEMVGGVAPGIASLFEVPVVVVEEKKEEEEAVAVEEE